MLGANIRRFKKNVNRIEEEPSSPHSDASSGTDEAGTDKAETPPPKPNEDNIKLSGTLSVHLREAAHMPNMDMFKKMDPYVVLWVEKRKDYGGDKKTRRRAQTLIKMKHRSAVGKWARRDEPPSNYDRSTTIFKGGSSPRWQEHEGKFDLSVHVENTNEDVLWIEVWDEDKFTPDELVGVAELGLAGVQHSNDDYVHELELSLPENPLAGRGFITFTVGFKVDKTTHKKLKKIKKVARAERRAEKEEKKAEVLANLTAREKRRLLYRANVKKKKGQSLTTRERLMIDSVMTTASEMSTDNETSDSARSSDESEEDTDDSDEDSDDSDEDTSDTDSTGTGVSTSDDDSSHYTSGTASRRTLTTPQPSPLRREVSPVPVQATRASPSVLQQVAAQHVGALEAIKGSFGEIEVEPEEPRTPEQQRLRGEALHLEASPDTPKPQLDLSVANASGEVQGSPLSSPSPSPSASKQQLTLATPASVAERPELTVPNSVMSQVSALPSLNYLKMAYPEYRKFFYDQNGAVFSVDQRTGDSVPLIQAEQMEDLERMGVEMAAPGGRVATPTFSPAGIVYASVKQPPPQSVGTPLASISEAPARVEQHPVAGHVQHHLELGAMNRSMFSAGSMDFNISDSSASQPNDGPLVPPISPSSAESDTEEGLSLGMSNSVAHIPSVHSLHKSEAAKGHDLKPLQTDDEVPYRSVRPPSPEVKEAQEFLNKMRSASFHEELVSFDMSRLKKMLELSSPPPSQGHSKSYLHPMRDYMVQGPRDLKKEQKHYAAIKLAVASSRSKSGLIHLGHQHAISKDVKQQAKSVAMSNGKSCAKFTEFLPGITALRAAADVQRLHIAQAVPVPASKNAAWQAGSDPSQPSGLATYDAASSRKGGRAGFRRMAVAVPLTLAPEQGELVGRTGPRRASMEEMRAKADELRGQVKGRPRSAAACRRRTRTHSSSSGGSTGRRPRSAAAGRQRPRLSIPSTTSGDSDAFRKLQEMTTPLHGQAWAPQLTTDGDTVVAGALDARSVLHASGMLGSGKPPTAPATAALVYKAKVYKVKELQEWFDSSKPQRGISGLSRSSSGSSRARPKSAGPTAGRRNSALRRRRPLTASGHSKQQSRMEQSSLERSHRSAVRRYVSASKSQLHEKRWMMPPPSRLHPEPSPMPLMQLSTPSANGPPGGAAAQPSPSLAGSAVQAVRQLSSIKASTVKDLGIVASPTVDTTRPGHRGRSFSVDKPDQDPAQEFGDPLELIEAAIMSPDYRQALLSEGVNPDASPGRSPRRSPRRDRSHSRSRSRSGSPRHSRSPSAAYGFSPSRKRQRATSPSHRAGNKSSAALDAVSAAKRQGKLQGMAKWRAAMDELDATIRQQKAEHEVDSEELHELIAQAQQMVLKPVDRDNVQPAAGTARTFVDGYGAGAPAYSHEEPQDLRNAFWRQPGQSEEVSAVKLQAVIRSFTTRKRTAQARQRWKYRRSIASGRLQGMARSWMVRRGLQAESKLQDLQRECAQVICTFWKKIIDEKRSTHTWQQWNSEVLSTVKEKQKVTMAAVNLQALWRGHRRRTEFHALRTAVMTVQTIFRGNVRKALVRAAKRAKQRVADKKARQAQRNRFNPNK